MGRVRGFDDGAPLAGATVRLATGATTTTGADGWFTLPNVTPGTVVVTAEAQGYVETIRQVGVHAEGDAFVDLMLARLGATADIDAAAGGSVEETATGAVATFPAGALVGKDGQPVTGTVSIAVAALDPATQAEALPGVPVGRNLAGEDRPLDTIAPVGVVARKGSEQLQLKSGAKADLWIPIPVGRVASAPATIGLWSLDPTTGAWKEEGTAASESDPNAASGFAYHGSVGHLSWWSGTRWLPAQCLQGSVASADGKGASYALVSALSAGFGRTFTGLSGGDAVYRMVVPADDSLSVIARSWDGRYASQPVTVRSAAGDNPRAGLHENCQAAGTLQLEAPAPSGPAGNGATALLPLLPTSDWTHDPGDINPVCSPPNPSETSFEAVGTGVVMRAAANGLACCTCVRRWRAWKLPAMFSTAKAHLRGYLETDHSTGMYVAPSFRVELIRGGSTRVGAKIFVTERTNNNNCAGSSERPEVLLQNPSSFDIDLSTLAASDTFDEIRVYLMAYGCGTVTMRLGVSRLLLETR